MHRMAVHDEKDFVWHRAHQAAQKGQKHLGSEMVLEHLKAQGAAVGQRRDEVATEALDAPLHHWGLALGGPASSGLVVRTQAHLVAPVDLGAFPLSPPVQGGVLVRHPASDGFRALLPGSLGRLLRR